MKINEHTGILTDRILLVPYSTSHVPTYHAWMQDEKLREATASEALTMDQEYAMQQSWRNDKDKLTFIVCIPPDAASENLKDQRVTAGKDDEPARMIGDVNMFVSRDSDANGGDDGAGRGEGNVIGELELMIAREEYQGKGLGRQILLVFMWYVLSHWRWIANEYGCAAMSNITAFSVKIGAKNERSLKLFQKLGFVKTAAQPNYFGEWELRWTYDAAAKKVLMQRLKEEVGIPNKLGYGDLPEEG